MLSLSVMSDSSRPHGLYSPPGSSVHGHFPGKNTRVSCHFLLQWILPTGGSNPGLHYDRRILYRLSLQGNPISLTFYSLPQRSKCHSSAPPPPLLLGSRWSRWDRLRPGTWSPLLRCLGRNTHLLEQPIQTIKGYKWSSAGRVGQITNKLQKDWIENSFHFRGVGSKSRVLHAIPTHSPRKEVG